jgi:stage V sporulation protein K
LFIDEAYALISDFNSGFGQEAIDTLVKAMEDNQNRFVVILAGYPEQTNQLLATNPGLFSRFPIQLDFPNFSLDELVFIFKQKLEQENYIYNDSVLEKAREYLRLEQFRHQNFFGNARAVQTLFELTQARLAERVVPIAKNSPVEALSEILNTINPEDVPEPPAYLIPPKGNFNWKSRPENHDLHKKYNPPDETSDQDGS